MLQALIDAIKHVDRHLRDILLGIIVLGGLIAILINYGHTLEDRRMASIERAISFIKDAREMEKDPQDAAAMAFATRLRETANTLLEKTGDIPVYNTYRKFGAGAAPWVIAFILTVVGAERREHLNAFMNSFALLVFAAAYGAVGAAIPNTSMPWFNLVVFPIGAFGCTLGVLMAVGIKHLTEPEGGSPLTQEQD